MRLFLLIALLASSVVPAMAASTASSSFNVPVEYYKLPNGLRVVLSPDHSAPTVAVGVYYRIGFRVEPRDRTGFAHLFEHMMFQGSRNLGKMEWIKLVQQNGGILNGSTRFDFTNYYEILPANKLETMLWAEADRMRGLADQRRQSQESTRRGRQRSQGECDQPSVWRIPLARYAAVREHKLVQRSQFLRRFEGHRGGNLARCQQFFKTYYAPNNAALAIVGDFEPADAKKMVEKYFGGIQSVPQAAQPDLTEPTPGQGEDGYEGGSSCQASCTRHCVPLLRAIRPSTTRWA